jgi:hypothetical protein
MEIILKSDKLIIKNVVFMLCILYLITLIEITLILS